MPPRTRAQTSGTSVKHGKDTQTIATLLVSPGVTVTIPVNVDSASSICHDVPDIASDVISGAPSDLPVLSEEVLALRQRIQEFREKNEIDMLVLSVTLSLAVSDTLYFMRPELTECLTRTRISKIVAVLEELERKLDEGLVDSSPLHTASAAIRRHAGNWEWGGSSPDGGERMPAEMSKEPTSKTSASHGGNAPALPDSNASSGLSIVDMPRIRLSLLGEDDPQEMKRLADGHRVQMMRQISARHEFIEEPRGGDESAGYDDLTRFPSLPSLHSFLLSRTIVTVVPLCLPTTPAISLSCFSRSQKEAAAAQQVFSRCSLGDVLSSHEVLRLCLPVGLSPLPDYSQPPSEWSGHPFESQNHQWLLWTTDDFQAHKNVFSAKSLLDANCAPLHEYMQKNAKLCGWADAIVPSILENVAAQFLESVWLDVLFKRTLNFMILREFPEATTKLDLSGDLHRALEKRTSRLICIETTVEEQPIALKFIWSLLRSDIELLANLREYAARKGLSEESVDEMLIIALRQIRTYRRLFVLSVNREPAYATTSIAEFNARSSEWRLWFHNGKLVPTTVESAIIQSATITDARLTPLGASFFTKQPDKDFSQATPIDQSDALIDRPTSIAAADSKLSEHICSTPSTEALPTEDAPSTSTIEIEFSGSLQQEGSGERSEEDAKRPVRTTRNKKQTERHRRGGYLQRSQKVRSVRAGTTTKPPATKKKLRKAKVKAKRCHSAAHSGEAAADSAENLSSNLPVIPRKCRSRTARSAYKLEPPSDDNKSDERSQEKNKPPQNDIDGGDIVLIESTAEEASHDGAGEGLSTSGGTNSPGGSASDAEEMIISLRETKTTEMQKDGYDTLLAKVRSVEKMLKESNSDSSRKRPHSVSSNIDESGVAKRPDNTESPCPVHPLLAPYQKSVSAGFRFGDLVRSQDTTSSFDLGGKQPSLDSPLPMGTTVLDSSSFSRNGSAATASVGGTSWKQLLAGHQSAAARSYVDGGVAPLVNPITLTPTSVQPPRHTTPQCGSSIGCGGSSPGSKQVELAEQQVTDNDVTSNVKCEQWSAASIDEDRPEGQLDWTVLRSDRSPLGEAEDEASEQSEGAKLYTGSEQRVRLCLVDLIQGITDSRLTPVKEMVAQAPWRSPDAMCGQERENPMEVPIAGCKTDPGEASEYTTANTASSSISTAVAGSCPHDSAAPSDNGSTSSVTVTTPETAGSANTEANKLACSANTEANSTATSDCSSAASIDPAVGFTVRATENAASGGTPDSDPNIGSAVSSTTSLNDSRDAAASPGPGSDGTAGVGTDITTGTLIAREEDSVTHKGSSPATDASCVLLTTPKLAAEESPKRSVSAEVDGNIAKRQRTGESPTIYPRQDSKPDHSQSVPQSVADHSQSVPLVDVGNTPCDVPGRQMQEECLSQPRHNGNMASSVGLQFISPAVCDKFRGGSFPELVRSPPFGFVHEMRGGVLSRAALSCPSCPSYEDLMCFSMNVLPSQFDQGGFYPCARRWPPPLHCDAASSQTWHCRALLQQSMTHERYQSITQLKQESASHGRPEESVQRNDPRLSLLEPCSSETSNTAYEPSAEDPGLGEPPPSPPSMTTGSDGVDCLNFESMSPVQRDNQSDPTADQSPSPRGHEDGCLKPSQPSGSRDAQERQMSLSICNEVNEMDIDPPIDSGAYSGSRLSTSMRDVDGRQARSPPRLSPSRCRRSVRSKRQSSDGPNMAEGPYDHEADRQRYCSHRTRRRKSYSPPPSRRFGGRSSRRNTRRWAKDRSPPLQADRYYSAPSSYSRERDGRHTEGGRDRYSDEQGYDNEPPYHHDDYYKNSHYRHHEEYPSRSYDGPTSEVNRWPSPGHPWGDLPAHRPYFQHHANREVNYQKDTRFGPIDSDGHRQYGSVVPQHAQPDSLTVHAVWEGNAIRNKTMLAGSRPETHRSIPPHLLHPPGFYGSDSQGSLADPAPCAADGLSSSLAPMGRLLPPSQPRMDVFVSQDQRALHTPSPYDTREPISHVVWCGNFAQDPMVHSRMGSADMRHAMSNGLLASTAGAAAGGRPPFPYWR